MATQLQDIPDNYLLFQQLDAYPWEGDQEFQGGLRAILGSVSDPQQVEHLTLRAKCYYYARQAGVPVDFDGYKAWVEGGHGHRQSQNGTEQVGTTRLDDPVSFQGDQAADGLGDAPKPASFAEICELIAEGKPIPGIKDIPDTILEGQASESQQEKRKKPWEKEAGGDDKPSWMT